MNKDIKQETITAVLTQTLRCLVHSPPRSLHSQAESPTRRTWAWTRLVWKLTNGVESKWTASFKRPYLGCLPLVM